MGLFPSPARHVSLIGSVVTVGEIYIGIEITRNLAKCITTLRSIPSRRIDD